MTGQDVQVDAGFAAALMSGALTPHAHRDEPHRGR